MASSNRPVSGHGWSRTQTFCLSVLGAEEAVDFFAVGALRRADVAIIGRHRALLQRADGASRRFDHDIQAGDECHRACALPEAPLRRHCDRHDSISRPIMRSAPTRLCTRLPGGSYTPSGNKNCDAGCCPVAWSLYRRDRAQRSRRTRLHESRRGGVGQTGVKVRTDWSEGAMGSGLGGTGG